MATDSNNIKLARITAAKAAAFASAVIAAGSIYWHEVKRRIMIGDGVTVGALGVAMESDLNTLEAKVVKTEEQTLTETEQTQALTNLGVIDALEELTEEYGGTVPTSLSENSIQTMNTEGNSDPWADLV